MSFLKCLLYDSEDAREAVGAQVFVSCTFITARVRACLYKVHLSVHSFQNHLVGFSWVSVSNKTWFLISKVLQIRRSSNTSDNILWHGKTQGHRFYLNIFRSLSRSPVVAWFNFQLLFAMGHFTWTKCVCILYNFYVCRILQERNTYNTYIYKYTYDLFLKEMERVTTKVIEGQLREWFIYFDKQSKIML